MKEFGEAHFTKHCRGPFEWTTGYWVGPNDCRVTLGLLYWVASKPEPGTEFNLRQFRLKIIRRLRYAFSAEELECVRVSSPLEEWAMQLRWIAWDFYFPVYKFLYKFFWRTVDRT